jgi:hypothetical protein
MKTPTLLVRHLRPLLAGAFLTLAAASSPAALVGFEFGIFDRGDAGIRNISDIAVTLDTLTISFAPTALNPTNDTFFDTTSAAPGVASTGWSLFSSSGASTITFPTDASTDGQQTATLSLANFDPLDSAIFLFDLDQFDNIDSGATPVGGTVTATFSDGSVVSGFIALATISIQGQSFTNSLSVTAAPAVVGGGSPIPEPTTALFGAALLGVVGLHRRRTAKA